MGLALLPAPSDAQSKWGPALLPAPLDAQSKWGPALLPAPTVAAAGTLAIQRLSLPASCRRSLPFGSHPRGRDLPVRSAVRSVLRGRRFLLAQPSVLRRLQLLATWARPLLVLIAGARTTVHALPRFLPLRACFLVPSFRRRSLWSGLAASLSDVLPRGRQGPFRAIWRAAPCSASAGPCPRSCDHRPCRFCFASGRHSGIRNRAFRCAGPPPPERASARWNWFHCILSCPARSVNFCLLLSALRRLSLASFPSRQDRCCASTMSRTSAKMRSYPQAAHLLVDNSASCGIRFVLVL